MRLSKYFLTGFILIFSIACSAFADVCPTPAQIAAGQLNGWQVYAWSNNPSPATPQQIQAFETYPNLIFTWALWHASLPPLPAVCVYSDPDIVLTKDTVQPTVSQNNHWQQQYRLGQMVYSCVSGEVTLCPFG